MVLSSGPYTALPVQEATIDVDTSGTWDGGLIRRKYICHIGFLQILRLEKKFPLCMIVSPYFSYGQQKRVKSYQHCECWAQGIHL